MATPTFSDHTANRAPSFLVRLAGRIFEVSPLTDHLEEFCHNYRIDVCNSPSAAEPDGFIELSPADIDAERARSDQPTSGARLEELALCRKVCRELLACDTILLHASCIAVDGTGYLFTAPSGTGKSTHTRLWRERFGGRALMVNDDKPYIHLTEDGAIVYGSPWSGEHRLDTNISVPVRALCILERADTDHIEPITAETAFPLLYARTYHPNGEVLTRKALSLIDRLTQQVKLFRLGCTMDTDAARVSYEAMSAAGKGMS